MEHKWRPIEDLPKDWGHLTDGELGPLSKFWEDRRKELRASGALEQFTTRLKREWAIETGQIEGVYDIDRGITQTLIERGIDADLIPRDSAHISPEATAAIIGDHLEVLEGLFQFVRGERGVSTSYIKEMHAALLKHQDTTTALDQFGQLFESRLHKGVYKTRPNNPVRPDKTIHEYCPPEHVEAEMDRLIVMHDEHEKRGVPVEVSSAWLHHRFAQIHPFQDGNGRVARSLASLLFIKEGWFPVVVTRDDRSRYIDALEVADSGDLQSLVALFVDIQKRAMFQAVQAAADLQPVSTVDEAIESIRRVVNGPVTGLEPAIWKIARENADTLMLIAKRRLDEVADQLHRQIEGPYEFRVSNLAMGAYVDPEALGYTPNLLDYRQVSSLIMEGRGSAEATVTAAAIGSKFRGLIGIAFVYVGPESEMAIVAGEPFQVNYAESLESAERRFRPWLERGLTEALTLWRRSL